MSDHSIIVIPKDPRFVPDKESQQKALARMQELIGRTDYVEIETGDGVQFVDCGANFERILCPSCGAEIATDWWGDQMNADYQGGEFALSTFAVPCCGRLHPLNELVYEWPQGFARFSLRARNANIGELSADGKQELEAALGTPLQVIYRHL